MRTLVIVTLCMLFAVPAAADEPGKKPAVKKPAAKKPVKKPAVKKPRKTPPAMQPVTDDPQLPRVLLIGDSISIGYTVPVREMLKGKANVHRPLTNCGPTTRGVAGLDAWLGDKKWDVIHFNFGLHDLKYIGPKGQGLADPRLATSRVQVPIDDYEKNLRKIVARLKKTGAVLIWRTTTPVPKGSNGRILGDAARYNAVAAKIMKENDIAVDDQYAFCMPRLDKIQLKANVHFTAAGSKLLAAEAVKAINTALKQSQKSAQK